MNELQEHLYKVVGYEPTKEQARIISCESRFILVAGGEQAGKSLVASKKLLSWIPQTEGPGLYWLVAADYERTRREFEYIAEDCVKLGILKEVTKRVDPGRIVLHDGTRIETKSARDPRTLAMAAPNGIVVCEASQVDLETYWRVRSRLGPKRGRLFMSGTFEGSLGWYPSLFAEWRGKREGEEVAAFSLPSWSNVHLYPGGRHDAEILKMERESSDEYFRERIGGEPCPPRGLVFPEFRAVLHIRGECEYRVGEGVGLWIDPGYAGAYAVEVTQEIEGQVWVVDEVYEQGLVTSDIIEVCKGRGWWRDVKWGVIDIAGQQHQAMAAPAEVWLKEAGLYLSSQKVRINEGTERLKGFLKPDWVTGEPKVVFSNKCRGVLSEFGAMASPIDGQTRVYKWRMDREGGVMGEEPEDKNNHGIKALIYGIVDKYGYSRLQNREKVKVRRW